MTNEETKSIEKLVRLGFLEGWKQMEEIAISERELLKSQLEQKDKEIADRDELLKDMADYLDDWVAGFEDLDLHDIQNWVTRLLTRYNSLIKKVDSMEQQSGKSEEGCHDKCTGPWDCTCQDMLNAYYGKKPKRD